MRRELELSDGRRVVLRDDVLDADRAALSSEPRVPPVRLAYAATRLVMTDGYADSGHGVARPGSPEEIATGIDWEATARQRRRLDGLGFAIAEAMDTAQRFEIGWENARELIRRTGALGLEHGFAAGAGVDHLGPDAGLDELAAGVVHQARYIQEAGGEVVLLPLVALARARCDADAYVRVYAQVIEQLEGPLYVHWLGPMFHAELEGYFPGDSFLRVMTLDPAKVRGAKLSLLDAEREVRLRRRLLESDQLLLTGDDHAFGGLLLGGDAGDGARLTEARRHVRVGERSVAHGDFSHALLGVLDAVAEPVGVALRHLARGDAAAYGRLMRPCEALGRWVFRHPTRLYKAGLAFVAWVAGHQSNAMLVNRLELERGREYFVRAVELASEAGLFDDVERVRERLEAWDLGASPGL